VLIYLWVALCGAIGSVARLWLGARVALLTGLGFPWGTILVNILGSLVIGFVAMLTGPNGRIAAPVEAQAFVVVGLCGGFTTFSAFGLQPSDLRARERRANGLRRGQHSALGSAVPDCRCPRALARRFAKQDLNVFHTFSTFHSRYAGAWMMPFRFLR
jgi:protein CrcB